MKIFLSGGHKALVAGSLTHYAETVDRLTRSWALSASLAGLLRTCARKVAPTGGVQPMTSQAQLLSVDRASAADATAVVPKTRKHRQTTTSVVPFWSATPSLLGLLAVRNTATSRMTCAGVLISGDSSISNGWRGHASYSVCFGALYRAC